MENKTAEQKQQQFEEFFSIAHQTECNFVPFDNPLQGQSSEQFEHAMPYPFKVASELSSLDAQALRPLRNLSEHATQLVDYLELQARKIDLIMAMILRQQDNPAHHYCGIKFGGGGVIIRSDKPMDVGIHGELKVFIKEEAAAIYSFAEVINCQREQDEYLITLIFDQIHERDQELLVRASLHMQTQQLKARAAERKSTTD